MKAICLSVLCKTKLLTSKLHNIKTEAPRWAPMKQFDLAPPSSLARAEASFGRVHLTALGGIRELQQKEQDDNGDDDLFAVTHLNP